MQTLEKLQPLDQTTLPASTPPQTVPLEKGPLEKLLQSVRLDSQRAPQDYLEESLVPGGGE